MKDMNTRLKKGIATIQAGDLKEGKRLLEQVLAEEPRNEQAWLWLSAAVDDVEERKAYLRRALGIDYDNEEAWRDLLPLVVSPPAPRVHTEPLPRAEGREVRCPGCGSDLRFSPRHQALVCPACGKVVDIPSDTSPPQSYPLAHLPATREAQEEWVGQQLFHCQHCGATTAFSSRRGSLVCPFCGSSALLKKPSGIPLISPQAVIPFKLDKEGAEQALHEWLGSGRLRPGDLSSHASVEQLHGVYIPYWLFDGLALVFWREGEVIRDTTEQYRNTAVCASLSLTMEMAQGVAPFEFDALVTCRPAYLAGWPVEMYQIALADATSALRRRIRQRAARLYGEIEMVRVVDTQWKLALLPVYLGAYRYRGELYLFAVNGQTGRLFGKNPQDRRRMGLLMAGIVLVVIVAAVLTLLLVVRLWWPDVSLLP
ncbi:MAG: hypothetical protein ACE5F6_18325 [Anaerolineae bacterium]